VPDQVQDNRTAEEALYGYALVEGNTTLREVVACIKLRMSNVKNVGNYYHRNLFSIQRNNKPVDDFLVFKV
jgi:hypothetical protein